MCARRTFLDVGCLSPDAVELSAFVCGSEAVVPGGAAHEHLSGARATVVCWTGTGGVYHNSAMGGSRRAAWRRRGSKALVAAGAVTCLGSAEAVGGWAALGQVPAHRGIGAPSEGARRPSHATHAASTRGALAFASVDKIGQRLERGIEELQAALKKKRLELCPWEEFGIECEKALTYHQLWINPCQVRTICPRFSLQQLGSGRVGCCAQDWACFAQQGESLRAFAHVLR